MWGAFEIQEKEEEGQKAKIITKERTEIFKDKSLIEKYVDAHGLDVDIDSLEEIVNEFFISYIGEIIKKDKKNGKKKYEKSEVDEIREQQLNNQQSDIDNTVDDKLSPSITDEDNDIKWLHLSDFHIKPSEGYKTSPIFEALQDDIEKLMEDYSITSFDFIIVTGDLGYFGKYDDYKDVESLLDHILDYTNTLKENLFIVPGNHDVNRKIVENQKSQIKTDWKSVNDANNFMEGDKTILRAFFKKFKGYSEFIENYFNGTRAFNHESNFSTHLLPIKDIKVALIGLNSCLISGKDKEEGTLMIAENQLKRALEEFRQKDDLKCDLKDIPVRICFFHHPLDCINRNEVKVIENGIFKNFDFLLNGHIHNSVYKETTKSDRHRLINIIAGSTFIRSSRPKEEKQCYNIIKINSKTLKGYGYFRRFDKGADDWAIDTSVGNEFGIVEVKIKKN